MPAAPIINAAPMTVMRGTQDKSTRQLLREPFALPTHLAKVFIYAQKGPTTPQLVSGDSRLNMYGADTFDPMLGFANHATVLANALEAQGNAQMLQRLIPTDAGPEANLLLSLDVLPVNVPVYNRNADGSLALDGSGNPVQTGSTVTAGYKVKWVVSNISTVGGMSAFGAAPTVAGDQVDVPSSTTSQRYPVLQFKASSVGSYGNNCGIRIWAPTTLGSYGVDKNIISKTLSYPVRVAMIRRATATSTAKLVESQFGEQSVLLSLKPNTVDPTTTRKLFIGQNLINAYRNVSDPLYPPEFGDFGSVYVYQNNLDTLQNMFYTKEAAYMTATGGAAAVTSDFTGVAGESYKFNIFGGTTSEGMPYSTYQFVSAGNAIRPSEYINIFAAGSSDGTMNDTAFADLVTAAMADYANPNSSLMDTAMNVESIMYDTGFPLNTKYALCNFIAARRDTFVVLATHVVGANPLSASDENSLAISLRTRLQMTPESDYFGTPVMRGMIMGRSAYLRSSTYDKMVPLTFQVAIKAAAYMGAGNGIWNSEKKFDGADGSIVTDMYGINVNFTPSSVRNKDWDAGLNWAQSYDRSSLFIPALKTAYTDDTSVLNSFTTALIICEINKVCERVWRKFSGVDHLTNAQLVERVNAEIVKQTQGRFDGRAIIEPNTFFTDADNARGYSWTTAVKIYTPNMKTVMTTYVQAFRIEDYTAA